MRLENISKNTNLEHETLSGRISKIKFQNVNYKNLYFEMKPVKGPM